MTNYISRKSGHVISNRGKIICVIATFSDALLPFIITEKDRAMIVPNKGTRIGKIDYAKIIRQVYAIFGKNKKVSGLSENIPRLLYINRLNRNESERLQVLQKFKTRLLSDGRIIISRIEIIDGKRVKRLCTYGDIDTAIRSQNHILENYIGKIDCELFIITEIELSIVVASNALLRWIGPKDSSIKEAEAGIKKSTDMLRRSRNIFKKVALAQLEKIPGMKDILGRINPSALAARSAKAGQSIKQRAEQVRILVAYAISLKTVLKNEKLEMEKNILSAKCILRALLNSSDKTWANQEFILEKLGQAIFFLQSVWANPFLDSANNAICLLMEARRNIMQCRLQLAQADAAAALTYLK